MEVARLFNTSLVSGCEQKLFRLLNQRKAVRDAKSAVATVLLLKHANYHLPWSFKIFINMLAFLYLKANSMEICEEIFVEIQG